MNLLPLFVLICAMRDEIIYLRATAAEDRQRIAALGEALAKLRLAGAL